MLAVVDTPEDSAGDPTVAIACLDPALLETLPALLQQQGIEPQVVTWNGERRPIVDERASMVVVEVDRARGLEPLEAIRMVTDAPTIAVIDATRSHDPVDVIDAGADDFVVQPCSPRVLAAKIGAWMRRFAYGGAVPPSARFGPLELDAAARVVRLRGKIIQLPRREFDLLAFLAQRPGRAFTRSELLARVWSASDEWLGPATVTEHVRRLRHRIEDDPAHPRWVQTVRRVGYRFEPPNDSE